MKNIVVTGGAGFIGSNLCRELVKQGNRVYSIDDYSSGYRRNLTGSGVKAIKGDVSNYEETLKTLNPSFLRVNTIYHLAASKKNICLKDPARDLEVNGRGAMNIALISKEIGARLVHVSTGSVYGECIGGSQRENHPLNPVSYYGVSKLAGEKYVAVIRPDAPILRYFHVYGPYQESKDHLGGVIAIWIRRIKEGQPIIVHGDGTQSRMFTHVDDVVRATILAGEIGSGVYNVVANECTLLGGVIEMLREVYGDKLQVEYQDPLPGDIKDFRVPNERIMDLGMENWIKLRDGLRDLC